jgi:V/A-type H+-transporting ATPase subunit I
VIVRMARVRIAGPRPILERILDVLQDTGLLHVDAPAIGPHGPADGSRERRHLTGWLVDVETAIARLGVGVTWPAGPDDPASPRRLRRRARRVRRLADRWSAARTALLDERALLGRYEEFFAAFTSLVGQELTWPDGQAFYVVLRRGAGASLAALTRNLETAVGGEVEVLHRELSSGEWAVLILVSETAAAKVSALLSAARVDELPVPSSLGHGSLLRAFPALKARLAEIPEALDAAEQERLELVREHGGWLQAMHVRLRDAMLRLDARSRVLAAEHLFIIEGWVPETRLHELAERLGARFGPELVVATMGAEDWSAPHAPVVLKNPPIFRPFEVLTRTLPLPRYGSIDPTPFVGVFFPAFFGLMMGDVGYGLMLGAVALVLRLRAAPGSTLRAVSTIGFACASASIVFGAIFGELFGTLGHFAGLYPLFDRERGTTAFLLLAIALGGVHVALGLVLGALQAWHGGHRRAAVGRGVSLAMLVLTALSILAAVEVLPTGLFTPLVVAVLVAFPILVALEGVVALVELLSTVGHILSYARIMALGTASLMLAVVANQMVGAMGSVTVGALFALLFHLVNFAIGVFSPTIHALRLHYVEFFGEFFSPGGIEYRPLTHWHPAS